MLSKLLKQRDGTMASHTTQGRISGLYLTTYTHSIDPPENPRTQRTHQQVDSLPTTTLYLPQDLHPRHQPVLQLGSHPSPKIV